MEKRKIKHNGANVRTGSVLDSSYFNTIKSSEYALTIQSKNTGHYWHILYLKYPHFSSCVVYHRHGNSGPYHLHGKAGNLEKAIDDIRKHDMYFLDKKKK